jgi:hypothetical protein
MQVLTNLEVSNVSGAGVNTVLKYAAKAGNVSPLSKSIKGFFDQVGTYLSTPIDEQPGFVHEDNHWEGNDGTNGGSSNSGWEGNGS